MVVGLASLVVWQWEDIVKLPAVQWGMELVAKVRVDEAPPAPPAPRAFRVAVARLERDADNELWHVIQGNLKEEPYLEVTPVGFTIAEGSEAAGHEAARRYLRRMHADVLIWGSVMGSGPEAVPQLYLTWADSPREMKREAAVPKSYERERAQRLPELFWNDLSTVLRLAVLTQASSEFSDEGRYLADKLPGFTDKVRYLLRTRGASWDARDRASTEGVLAEALYVLGLQNGQDEPLRESIALYEECLKTWTRRDSPVQWALTQNNLGKTLTVLGERESGTERLEEAVVAFRAALKERTRERVPLEWAGTQNNLGIVLTRLGKRESGTERLEEAVVAFRAALEEKTRERVPRDWAATQNNLGNALTSLGEREPGTERLEEAVVAYRAALEETTRERVPLGWAAMQNNLGIALMSLGEREPGTERLEEAVVAFRAALEEGTRGRVPLEWALTQNNLGTALTKLGEREPGTERLEEAVVAYRAALEERTRERVPLDWAATQNNLGVALMSLGKRKLGTERLEEAVVAFRAALEEGTRERVPLDWAITQNNLGVALTTLGLKTHDAALLCAALPRYFGAWVILSAANDVRAAEPEKFAAQARQALAAHSADAARECPGWQQAG
ncbi:tetratricopeptide repeat protein [Corallococcus exercitus]|uniref:tetratricopeptide repeat protein n=1 Tax=Corallococcus exercitus TaxID=2316736 RepID=UPI0035D4FA03